MQFMLCPVSYDGGQQGKGLNFRRKLINKELRQTFFKKELDLDEIVSKQKDCI